jgi:hypothetical protein
MPTADQQGVLNDCKAFIELCRNNNVSMAVVLFQDLKREHSLSFLVDRVLKLCDDEKIHCIDLRDRLASAGDPSNLWVNQFDHHPNRRANEIAARAVLDAFGAEWAVHAKRLEKVN